MAVCDQAFVTFAGGPASCQGALVLAQSLRTHGTARKLVVLAAPQVSERLRRVLARVFDEVVRVDLRHGPEYVQDALATRPELDAALGRLHCWTLTSYSKAVFLGPDTMVLAGVDELFERAELSAAPEPGWPDWFSSAVFVFRPSLHTHRELLRLAALGGSLDGSEQGILNSFFSSWPTADLRTRLPFTYNLSTGASYTYGPAFLQFGSAAKVVRFSGPAKPWHYKYDPQTGAVWTAGSGPVDPPQRKFLQAWWRLFHRRVLPLYGAVAEHWPEEPPSAGYTAPSGHPEAQAAGRAPGTGTVPGADAAVGPSQPWAGHECSEQLRVEEEEEEDEEDEEEEDEEEEEGEEGAPASPGHSEEDVLLAVSVSEISIQDRTRRPPSPRQGRREWEEGHIDYMGRDAFAHIQEKLDRFLH
ncbi:LOW QUALITY PROTEIN: glycogenin-2 [Sorex araneus]|uniref:LOW QUALITY PROTEIN: glycogenin-2 n=1 Tax=Sorex araneus TaxID=42254 RepID=UPI00243357B0|nr:LOW QUALITY PROTEIN: glycogenin-2 [Sorex araneus]